MFTRPLLVAAALALHPWAAAQHAAREPSRVLAALDAWTDAYRVGRIDLRGLDDATAATFAQRAGLVRKGADLQITRARELELLLDAAAGVNTAAAIQRVVRLAGTGLDRTPLDVAQTPALVRALAEAALPRFNDGDAVRWVLSMARGEVKASWTSEHAAMRAAAVRALAMLQGEGLLAELTARLADREPALRLAAAEALQQRASIEHGAPLVAAIAAETDEPALIAEARALHDWIGHHGATAPTRVLRDGAAAVLGAIGRASWRADLTLVDVVAQLRTPQAVPVLIDVLARHTGKPANGDANQRSGTLRARAGRLLQQLTGALFAADRPDQWRAFWAREGRGFRLAPVPAAERAGAGTVAQGFFGIEPTGLNVAFVIDVSLSMEAPYLVGRTVTALGRAQPTRLDVAKAELVKAIDALAPEARFNIIVFAANVRPWHDDLVPADAAHKNEAGQFVERLQVEPATNLWGGFDRALRITSHTVGDRYASPIDELFVLSDGAPTAGVLQDPGQILLAINSTNRFSCVRIHCVCLDEVTARRDSPPPLAGGHLQPAEMMAEIARANGGRFVQPR